MFAFGIGFCFVSALGHGIIYFKITTDPVELWAAPNSQSRIEKEFFDSHFEPFYRIEQVIIRSDGPPVIHNSSGEIIEFGPAFDRDFLLEIFELQNGIKGLLIMESKVCLLIEEGENKNGVLRHFLHKLDE